jgi:hypothetical protein
MRILDYKHIIGSATNERQIVIEGLTRDTPATPQFINLAGLDITLEKPTAFIYVDGTTVAQADAGIGSGNGKYVPAIKTGSAFTAHQWLKTFNNNEHLKSMEVVAGTCASGIHAIKRADEILRKCESEEVIIIGQERTTNDTLRLFRELGIPVTCGDGFVYMKLSRGHDIADVKWRWAYNDNPFVFTRETLDELIPAYRLGYVKLHGTGTKCNEDAEAGLAEVATPLSYKHIVGHTQGISALIETCIVLEDPKIRGRILVTANGLGGYYGAFTLTKPYARDI